MQRQSCSKMLLIIDYIFIPALSQNSDQDVQNVDTKLETDECCPLMCVPA